MRDIWRRGFAFRLLGILLASSVLSACGVNKAIIADTTSGPREIFVNLANDPLLITIELKTILMAKGYKVALSSESADKAVVKNTDSGSVIYKNVSESNYRYELILGYQPVQNRIQLIAASLRDRKLNEVLGTYRWSWDRMLPAPTIEGAVEKIDENLLSKVFR